MIGVFTPRLYCPGFIVHAKINMHYRTLPTEYAGRLSLKLKKE
jgi:hypothetical protein